MTVYAPPGHFYSPIVNPDDIVGLRLADANFASPDISGVTLDSEAMVRLWRGAKEILNSVPFSEEPTSGHHHYFKNDFYSKPFLRSFCATAAAPFGFAGFHQLAQPSPTLLRL